MTDARRCHVNLVIYDSGWEAEFCRVAESHPRVLAYVKNHSLGFEVPYAYGSQSRKYRPDFIVLVDDGGGPGDPLRLVVEIKGYRREDAKEKKAAMETHWVPGVNNLGTHGRWASAGQYSQRALRFTLNSALPAAMLMWIIGLRILHAPRLSSLRHRQSRRCEPSRRHSHMRRV